MGAETLSSKQETASRPRISREALGLVVLSLLSACEGLGPFAGAWLTANPIRQYSPGELGILNAFQQALLTVMQPFLGKLVDWSRHKRSLLGMGSLSVGASVALTVFVPQWYWLQVLIQVPMAVGLVLVPLTLNALTLGVMEPAEFTRQVALNNVALHVGTVLSGAAMAACALFLPKIYTAGGESVASPMWSAIPLLCSVLTVIALPIIRRSRIDYARAAGMTTETSEVESASDESSRSETEDQSCRPHAMLVVFRKKAFLHLLALAFMLNFANMAQLQLAVQNASQLNPGIAIPYTSAAQIVAHLGMTVSSLVAGNLADRIGRKPLLVVSCLVVSVRALLTAVTVVEWVNEGGTVWLTLVPCQLLDGVGAGLWGVLVVLLSRDISAGTGCFNLAFGCIQAFFAAGAIVSSAVAGAVANDAGFGHAFLVLAAAGAISTIQALAMPETAHELTDSTRRVDDGEA